MKKNVALAIALTFVMSSASAADMTEHQKVLYAIGQVLADQVGVFALTPDELKSVQQGLHDGVTGAKSAVDMTVYGPKIKPLAEERAAAAGAKVEVSLTPDDPIRLAGAAAVRLAGDSSVAFLLPTDGLDEPGDVAQALVERALLASYSYKAEHENTSFDVVPLATPLPSVESHNQVSEGVQRGAIVAEAGEDDVGAGGERLLVRDERGQRAVQADVERGGRAAGERVRAEGDDLELRMPEHAVEHLLAGVAGRAEDRRRLHLRILRNESHITQVR